MINNHYLKLESLEPPDLTQIELFIFRIIQRDFLMDLEHIYNEIKLINYKISFDIVRNNLLNLRDKKLVIEITEEDINVIIIKKSMRELEQKTISYSCDWALA